MNIMAHYELGDVTTARGLRRELWEHTDGDRRSITVDLSNYDAPRICTLLNLTRPKAGGLDASFLRTLTEDELRHLVDNAAKALMDRASEPPGDPACCYTDDDTINAIAAPHCSECDAVVVIPHARQSVTGAVLCDACYMGYLGSKG